MDTLLRAPQLIRCGRLAACLAACLTIAACGSSSTTITSPGGLSKCAVTLGAPASTLPASGGTGSIAVQTSRECQWTASSEAGWLTLVGGTSGQGEGTIQYRVGANADPVQRTAALVANDVRVQVSQAAGECSFELASTSASFPKSGGSGSVQVRASSPLCGWTAASHTDWIDLRSGAGQGTASVAYEVEATTGPPRTGTMMIAGKRHTVTQSEGCTFSIAPTTHSAPPSGGSGTIAVTAAPGCPWMAASNVDWITVNLTTTAIGSGAVRFTVAPSTGPERTGTLNVAGDTFTVVQSAGCTYEVSPATHAIDAAGGSRSVTVTAQGGCAWDAASNASWITVSAGQSGAGRGTVTFEVAATNGPSRAGTLTVAGQTVAVTQGQGCTYSITPDNHSVPASGGSGSVSVSAGDGCSWTAQSRAPDWITITSGASGSGGGSVAYSVAGTTGPSRSGTIEIAGRTFTVNQGQGCSFSLSSSDASVPAGSGTGSFNVAASDGCAWSASSNAPDWISITSGASGNGPGTVAYAVTANTGSPREGTITAAGRTFTVKQAGACTYTIAPESESIPASGGSGSVSVTTGDGCSWTAQSRAPDWITITSGASGSGGGGVAYSVAGTTGPSRSGTIEIAGRTFTVNQASGCTFTIAPESADFRREGGTGTVTVTTADGCAWSVARDVSWISVISGADGSGSGAVQFTVEPNPGDDPRSGTLTVAGRTFTVKQGDD